jgi:hypothetical protein
MVAWWQVQTVRGGVSNLPSSAIVGTRSGRRTSVRLGRLLPRDAGLLKGPPLEVLIVPAAGYGPFGALLARGFRLVALQTLVLAGNASCAKDQYSAPVVIARPELWTAYHSGFWTASSW